MHRDHFAEGAAGETSSSDIDEVETARLRLELRFRSHPAQDFLWIGQEGEHRSRWRRNVGLPANDESFFLHQSSPLVVAACPACGGAYSSCMATMSAVRAP